jgi:hypothetical protein
MDTVRAPGERQEGVTQFSVPEIPGESTGEEPSFYPSPPTEITQRVRCLVGLEVETFLVAVADACEDKHRVICRIGQR